MADFDLQMSFFIDTDAYSDRDRQMFVCGVEWQMVYQKLLNGDSIQMPIHTENESRVRMMCAKLKRRCDIKRSCETWSALEVL